MGLFDDNKTRTYSTSGGLVRTHSHSKDHHSHSEKRTHSPARSTKSGTGGYFVRPHNSSARSVSGSIFGGEGGERRRSGFGEERSRGAGSFFSSFGSGGSSHYKRRPRDGYISYLLAKLKRMFRELWHYARRHPVKAFFAVVVPLLSAGGAIHGLLRQFGVRVPGLDGGSRRSGGGYYGSTGYERRTTGFSSGGLGGFGSGGGGLMENAGSLLSVAKMFM